MGRVYENPPLVEVVCDFRFEPSQPWDWTIPGLIYDRVKSEYPHKRQQNIVEVEFKAEQEEIAQRIKGGVARMQFLRSDERALLQVGPDLLTVNHLKPYPSWTAFKEMIVRALKVYREVAAPKGIRRIGLRYINKIEIPKTRVEIEDYLLAVPQVPEAVPQVFARFVQRVEIMFEQANGLLILQTGSVQQEAGTETAFMLDLDFITLQAVTLDAAMDWVEQAHDHVERTFETCITDNTRKLFKERKEETHHE
jgi:uncharacterized protein (TIGR04255 family)